MSSSGETAQAPDMTFANSQWGEQMKVAKEAREKAQKWADEHGTTLDEALKQIQGRTLQAGRDTMDVGTDLMRKYQEVYGPLQEYQAQYAQEYASPDRQKQAMAQAGAGVSQAFKAAGDAANRNFERYGGDPGVGRGGALDLGVKLAEATAKAQVKDNARRAVETTGQQLVAQAIGTGQGVGQMGLGATQAGVQAGATGIGEGTSTYGVQAPVQGNALGWFGGGNQALGGFVNTTMQDFANQSRNAEIRNKASSENSAAWGKLAGTLASAAMFAADGGTVPENGEQGGEQPASMDPMASPGSAVPLEASPSRGAVEDDVSAQVQAGEFIFPEDVMKWKGEEWAQKEIIKARKAMGNPDEKPAKPEMKQALNLPPTYMSPGALNGGAVPLGNQQGA